MSDSKDKLEKLENRFSNSEQLFLQQQKLNHDEQLIGNMQKYTETTEERKTRAQDAYYNLHDIAQRHNVKLTRSFNIDDDPEEMEEEYKMHKQRMNKTNQVKLYEQILLIIVCGAKFINEKYNLFEFKPIIL